jgi:hypothetical protein
VKAKQALSGLVAALAATIGLSTTAFAAAAPHKDEAPGYFRVKVGALEVTALFDGAGAFQTDWLKGKPEGPARSTWCWSRICIPTTSAA